ncbi:MAG: MFS transporter [Chloroflexota bacterium]
MSLSTTIQLRFPALASREFRIFWIGQFVSLIGSWMQNTTQPLLAYRISGRPFDLGLIGFAATLPTLLLAIPGGVLIEHLDKRKTVIAMQSLMMLQAFTLAFLTLTGVVQIWHIIVLALVLGVATSLEITARQAMLIELVGREALPNAIALQTTIFNAARVLGPMMVAPFLLLIGEQGEGWAFLANGTSYLVIIIGLMTVRPRFKAEVKKLKAPWVAELREGQRYILQTRSVGLIILMATLVGFFGFPLMQQIPVFASEVLRQAGDTSAAVAARNSSLYTFMGIGALVAALYAASFSHLRRKGLLMTIGQFTFISGMISMGLVRLPALAMAVILFMGWGMVSQLAMMNTLIQVQVPDELRGRVFSTYLWALQGVAPFGSLFIGWMAQNWSVPIAAIVAGCVCLLGVGTIHLVNPDIRDLVT